MTMHNDDDILGGLVSGINELNLAPFGFTGPGKFIGWDNPRANLVSNLLMKSNDAEIRLLQAIDQRLKVLGRFALEGVSEITAPDHSLYPQALAYALVYYVFKDSELSQIKLYYSDTIGPFIIEQRPWNLPKEMLEYISTRQPVKKGPVSKWDDYDWGDTCC